MLIGEILTASAKKACPYLPSPFEECFCEQLDSQTIPKALEYCVGDFRECEIYQRHQQFQK